MTSRTRTNQQRPSIDSTVELPPDAEAAAIGRFASAATAPTEITVLDDDDQPLELRVYGVDERGGHVLVDTVELEQHRDEPGVRRGSIEVATPAALVTYARRHLDDHRSTLWGDIDRGRLTVVLNDHADGEFGHEPGWADHQVSVQMKRSPEWEAWTAINGKPMSQVELALFLEEHLLEIVEPNGSTLLEITQTFHATEGATFKSSQAINSGEQRLTYEQTIEAQAGRNASTEIPTDLTLAIRPWLGVERVPVKAKFRFRIRDGRLVLFVSLLNLEEVSRAAVENALSGVADELDLAAIEGTAPLPRR